MNQYTYYTLMVYESQYTPIILVVISVLRLLGHALA